MTTATLTKGESVRLPESANDWWAGNGTVVGVSDNYATVRMLDGREAGYTGTFDVKDLERVPQVGDTISVTVPKRVALGTIKSIDECGGMPTYLLDNGEFVDTCYGDRTVAITARAPQPPVWKDGDVINVAGLTYLRRGTGSQFSFSAVGTRWSAAHSTEFAASLTDAAVNEAFRKGQVVHLVRDGAAAV